MLLTVFTILNSIGYNDISYPSAFFVANLIGLFFLTTKIEFKGLLKTNNFTHILHETILELPQSLRLCLNNLVNIYMFNIFVVIGSSFWAPDIIGAITLAHMVAAVILYSQPVVVNRLTPFLYELTNSITKRQVWRNTIDRLATIGYPLTLVGLILTGSVISYFFTQNRMGGLAAITITFICGYIARLFGAVNQLWLIHVQRKITLWKWNVSILAIAICILTSLSDSDGLVAFPLIFALAEWTRSVGFSIWAKTIEPNKY